MAARGWGGSIATAVAVAAGTGAAQLGVGYGLGIIAWPAEAGGAGEGPWVASLAWATWIAATSVVAGAVSAHRPGPGALPIRQVGAGKRGILAFSLWRAALALAAAIGALVTVALVAVPARAVDHPTTSSAETIAGGYVVAGVVVGLIVSIGALASRAIALNVIASVSWLWLLAVVAVVDRIAAGHELATAQLAVWQFPTSGPTERNIQVWQALLTLGAALVIGMLTALPAARRGDNGVGIAVSGAVGPLLVAAAYFLAAPELTEIPTRELSTYLVVPYAVIAGLAGSVTVAGLAARHERRRAPAEATSPAPDGTPPDEEYAPARAYPSEEPGGPVGGDASIRSSVWPEESADER